MPKLTTTQRASIAALTRSATTDPVAMTAPARTAFQQRFIDRARAASPPDTPEPEIERRAVALRRVFYARLSAAGVAGQRKKKGRVAPTDPAPEGGAL